MSELRLRSVEIILNIVPESALHIGTGLGLARLLDDRIVCGPHPLVDGAPLPYIPGSSLKGRLRYHARRVGAWLLEERAAGAAEARLFGTPARTGGLTFADAHIADVGLARALAAGGGTLPRLGRGERSFVGLSRQRRVAIEQRLFRLELADGDFAFEARIQGYLPDPDAPHDLALLLAAAADLTHLGGHKARGLGACRCHAARIWLDGVEQDARALLEVLR